MKLSRKIYHSISIYNFNWVIGSCFNSIIIFGSSINDIAIRSGAFKTGPLLNDGPSSKSIIIEHNNTFNIHMNKVRENLNTTT